jgi:tight adherence protein B
MIGRRLCASAIAFAAVLWLAGIASGAATSTRLGAVTGAGPNAVRVIIRAPGTITTTMVSARLGAHWAYVESVTPSGKRPPLNLVIALDTSRSMRGPAFHAAVAAADRLLDAVGSGDRVGLVTFAKHVRVVVPLTSDVTAVSQALDQLTTGRGTALDQGVTTAVSTAGGDTAARRVVVLVSDGADTTGGAATTLPVLTASGVRVDAFGLNQSSAFRSGPLQAIAHATGGSYANVTSHRLQMAVTRLRDSELAGSFSALISLPQTGARDLHVSVLDAPATTVQLPPGVSGRSEGFWLAHGELIVAVLGFAAVLALSMCILQLGRGRPPSLDARLAEYTAIADKSDVKGRGTRLADLYERIEGQFEGSLVWRHLDALCQQAGIANPTAQVLLGIVTLAVLIGLIADVLLGSLVGVAGFLVGALIPVWVLRSKATRRSARFEAQLPELLAVWASALRAGRSFAQALDTLVDEADEPAHGEFRRAQQQVRLGVPIEVALDEMSRRLRSDSFELVVLTTDVQRRVGGNVALIFDRVADTVRKRQQFGARVRALTSMGRLSAYVLIGLPFAMAAGLTLINADYMLPLFTTYVGHILIVVALVMMALGSLVLRRLVKPRTIA